MIRFFVLAALLMISRLAVGQTLGQALNATNLTWTTSGTGGAQGWTAQNSSTHDGVSAAMSGSLNFSSQSSTVQTTVSGPGTLSFWWRNPSGNLLSFITGTTTLASIASYPSWQPQIIYLGSGTQTLKWTLSYLSPGDTLNRAYLDEVSYTPGATAPIITAQPPGQSQVPGLNATFGVGVVGTPPFNYQWCFNDADIPGAIASTLTVTNVQTTNLGDYSVMITNVAGSIVSSNGALEFGQVTAWGYGAYGQTAVATGATNVLAVSGGELFSLAMKADGTLLAWGTNRYGQLTLPSDLTNVISADSGFGHCLALRADGSVVAWGRNSAGETNVPADLTNAVAIAAGGIHSVALKSDGTVVAWGNNNNGQTNVPIGLTNVVAIAAGGYHSLALQADGTVIGWGWNGFGQTNTPSNLSNVVAIGAGYTHSLALKSDGTVAAWGDNTYGQRNVPADVTNVVAIAAAAYYHNLALRGDGTVVAWGWNSNGQTNVPPGLSNVVAIGGGNAHSVAAVGSGPPALTSPLRNPNRSGNRFDVSVTAESGHVFALEYKDSLTDGNWTPLPLVAGNGGIVVLTDSTATASQRFYRVRRW